MDVPKTSKANEVASAGLLAKETGELVTALMIWPSVSLQAVELGAPHQYDSGPSEDPELG